MEILSSSYESPRPSELMEKKETILVVDVNAAAAIPPPTLSPQIQLPSSPSATSQYTNSSSTPSFLSRMFGNCNPNRIHDETSIINTTGSPLPIPRTMANIDDNSTATTTVTTNEMNNNNNNGVTIPSGAHSPLVPEIARPTRMRSLSLVKRTTHSYNPTTITTTTTALSTSAATAASTSSSSSSSNTPERHASTHLETLLHKFPRAYFFWTQYFNNKEGENDVLHVDAPVFADALVVHYGWRRSPTLNQLPDGAGRGVVDVGLFLMWVENGYLIFK